MLEQFSRWQKKKKIFEPILICEYMLPVKYFHSILFSLLLHLFYFNKMAIRSFDKINEESSVCAMGIASYAILLFNAVDGIVHIVARENILIRL